MSLKPRSHSLSATAAYLGIRRNTMIRHLRELGVLDADNLPAGRYRNDPRFVVRTRTFNHPVTGPTEYGRTEVTHAGRALIDQLLKTHWEAGAGRGAEPQPPRDYAVPGAGKAALPEGALHDAGGLTVITDDGERTHHRAALVLVFDSPASLQRAIDAQWCAYQARRDIPEAQLHPEQRDNA